MNFAVRIGIGTLPEKIVPQTIEIQGGTLPKISIPLTSIEQALLEDEFINVNGLPEQVMRDAYKRIYDAYQPGPVMDFEHYPTHFEYHHPNEDDGQTHCTDYAGEKWRAEHSSAAPPLVPGSDRFTLDKVGVPGAVEKGGALLDCGAKLIAPVTAK